MAGCPHGKPPPADPSAVVPAAPPKLVLPEEVAPFVGHDGVVLIDARPRAVYRKGHAPGAVQVDWTEFRRDDEGLLTGTLDGDLDKLAGQLGGRGIGREDWAIVFGDPTVLWGEEGRVVWTLRYLGAERVSVVDGGWPAWHAAKLPVERGAVSLPARPFPSRVDERILARKAEVDDARRARAEGSWRRVLVDVRDFDEYQGLPSAPLYGAARRGHIPGAVSLPWRTLLDGDGRILSREQLGSILLARGVRPDASIILYCTGGVRSAHTWMVLDWLGYPDIRNYAGSMWEWALDRSLPVQSGAGEPPPEAPPFSVAEAPPRAPEPSGDDDSGR
jgi:thiosulfate/3-mercaptopyruvate sulfurtransferase